MGFILTLTAYILISILYPIGILFGVFNKGYFFRLAIALDQLGNVLCGEFLNTIMINSKNYLFGNPDETISSVLGKNKLNNSLTFLGKFLDSILNKLDENHSIKSIEEDEVF